MRRAPDGENGRFMDTRPLVLHRQWTGLGGASRAGELKLVLLLDLGGAHKGPL